MGSDYGNMADHGQNCKYTRKRDSFNPFKFITPTKSLATQVNEFYITDK